MAPLIKQVLRGQNYPHKNYHESDNFYLAVSRDLPF